MSPSTGPEMPPDSEEAPAAGLPEDAAPRRRLSRRARRVLRDLHQRTWELEFLMSGALAVALGQVPARVDAAFNRIFPLLGDGAGLTALLAYQYVKLIVYTLILTFVIHVVLRAFWVSLIGLDSVFPRGVRWDRVRLGPVSRAFLKRHLPSVRELIVRTDGVASVLFAAAFYVVAIFLVSVVIVGVLALPLLLLGTLLPWRLNPTHVLVGAAVVFSMALTLPTLLDRILGDRIDPGGLLARWIRATHRINLRGFGLSIYGPGQYTLTSQLGGGRTSLLLITVLVGLTATFIVRDVLVQRERLQWGTLGFVPEVVGAAGVEPRYYESQWTDPSPTVPVPSIPTDVLDEEATFLRLFVPFRPVADPDAVAALCPGLPPVGRLGLRFVRPGRGVQTDSLDAAIARSLACAGRLWEVDVDGRRPVESPVFATHPLTGLPGLSWYLDVRDLARGRHLILVRRGDAAYAADMADDAEPRPRQRHEIPFWR